MTYNIACIGEPLAEVSRAKGDLSVGYGGDTLNTAIYCARAVEGHDICVHYLTALGQDVLSEGALDLMQNEGIGTDYVTRDPERQIGIYAIQNDENGERSFHYWRDTSAARKMFDTDDAPELAALEQFDLIYLSGITLAILSPAARDRLMTALTVCKANGARVAFDSNYRPKLWESAEVARAEVTRFWAITDIALPSVEDEMDLFKSADPHAVIDRIKASDTKTGALKCGAEGPIPFDLEPVERAYPAATKVIDTTGAGDSFNGAYLAGVAKGLAQGPLLLEAHNLAVHVVGYQGAILPIKPPVTVQRMGMLIGLKPEALDAYKKLHADVWPAVLARLSASHITNYSIFLRQPENLMFGYWEYVGSDFATDNAAIAADPVTKDWWAVCGPMQDPLESRMEGEWWAEMEEVFHLA